MHRPVVGQGRPKDLLMGRELAVRTSTLWGVFKIEKCLKSCPSGIRRGLGPLGATWLCREGGKNRNKLLLSMIKIIHVKVR